MARISYVIPEAVTDPQIRRWLDDAIAAGRPGPENQAIRAHQPDVMRSFTLTREMLFDNGRRRRARSEGNAPRLRRLHHRMRLLK